MKYQLSKTRIEMEKAYLEICKRRQYVGARRSDILDWLAEYADKRDADLKAKYQKAVEALKFYGEMPLPNIMERVKNKSPYLDRDVFENYPFGYTARQTLAELGEKE